MHSVPTVKLSILKPKTHDASATKTGGGGGAHVDPLHLETISTNLMASPWEAMACPQLSSQHLRKLSDLDRAQILWPVMGGRRNPDTQN